MKVLVSGGTGFIGEAIVRALAREGHVIRVLSRSLTKLKTFFPNLAIEGVLGDITNADSINNAVGGIDWVVQCAQFPGHPVENPKKGYTYWQVDALGTENLAKAAKMAGVKRFIYLSGAGTDEKRREPWFRAKWYAEQAIHRSGMLATILRPSWVYGPKDKSLNRFISMIRYSPFLPLIGMGKNHVQPIFVEDLANIVIALLSHDGAPERIFDVGGPDEMTMKDMMQILLGVLQKRRLIVPIPKLLVKMGAFPFLSPGAIDFITMDVRINITPLQKSFPKIHLRTFEEGLKSYLIEN